ncbi:uncharacterized protein LOC131252970 isoform X3 [Magnolia sinica]|nr:uncharacterized protein LOC131252970 isoform X3 [Magnolia sinica]
MNPMVSRSNNHQVPGWQLRSEADRNLVIRFSDDDDSGSDSEEHKSESASERRGTTPRVDADKIPAASTQLKTKNLQRPPTTQTEKLKKVSLNHSVISSIARIHGPNFRGTGTYLSIERESRIQRNESLNKASTSREPRCVQGAKSTDSELEILRRKIALRENELKLQRKSMPQRKEKVSGSYADYHGTHAETDADKLCRPASVNTVELAIDEQEKNCLKLVEHSHTPPNSDGQLQTPVHAKEFTSELKEQVMENVRAKDIPMSTTHPRVNKRQGKYDERVPLSSGDLVETKQGDSPISFVGTTLSTPNFGVPSKEHNNSLCGAGISGNCSQKDNSHGLVDASRLLNRSSTLVQSASNAEDGVLEMPPAKKFCSEMSKHRSIVRGTHASSFSPDKASSQHNLVNNSEHNEIISHNGIQPHTASNIFDECSNHVQETTLATFDASLQSGSLMNYLNQWNAEGRNSMDVQNLAKMEELLDKELEEAQELRRRCELEERSALKAYRSAQRALVDSNERCSYLYQKRELFSAQFRALAMENSGSLWSSRWHGETGLDSIKNVPKANVNLLPHLSCQLPADPEVMDQEIRESNTQLIDGAPHNKSYQRTYRHILGSEPCSEPDASTSEQLPHKDSSAMDGFFSPSNLPDVSADEDEAVESILACAENVEKLEERAVAMNEELEGKSYVETVQDTELVEASLRSELFARLGMRTLPKNSDMVFNREHNVDKIADNDVESRETHMSMGKLSAISDQQPVVEEKNQMADMEGTEMPGSKSCWISSRKHDKNHCDKPYFDNGSNRSTNPEESSSSPEESCRPTCASVFSLPSSVLKIVFKHMKVMLPGRCKGYQTKQELSYGISHEEAIEVNCFESQLVVFRADATANHIRDARIGKLDSGTSDLAIDPFWPFCMFELRGKCNNDECSWQHAKDYTQRNLKQLNDSSISDGQDSPLILGNLTDARELPHGLHHYIVPVPTYRIGPNLIKADKQSSGYVLPHSICQYWQRDFCSSFVVPFSVLRTPPPDVPYSQAGDSCAEDHGSWNRLSLYFRSQDDTTKQAVQGLAASEQSLELALDLFNGTVNEQEGKKKALAVLSRALEVDPTSVVLWIVYLHIYYRKEKAIGKDDMFSLAIRHNEGSYELWLMYINSRMHLGDRLDAYDTALSTLCRLAHTPNKESKYSSACILDLFLQMVDFLCMSGDVEKAISRICGVLPTAMDFDSSSITWLSDILRCLTISDKCILWVCCVYLLVYKKLPETVMQRFESEKELPLGLEWPSIQLTSDKKDRAIELMKMAADAMSLSIDGDSDERVHLQGDAFRSVHSLAVNHTRCVAALEGLDCAKDLLVKYLKQYPTCIELVLTLARWHKDSSGEERYDGFEEALRNWPREVPGIQCLWNQYAEYALENGSVSFAEELMCRWFESSWKVQDAENGKLDLGGSSLRSSSEIPSSANSGSCAPSNPKDELFGLLNLSLHRLLQNDQARACIAIDKALKLAGAEDLRHFVREHASFLLSNGSDLDSLASGIPSLLLSYLSDTRTFPISEPLSRKFGTSIKKPRIRKLINAMLGPVSLDCSLMNSILREWYGPPLLPENFEKLKDLVDLVEALMEILPANYQLAMSACKLVTRNPNIVGIVSASAMFWASSLLVNSIFQAFPVVPEQSWIEAANVLGNIEMKNISERFHQQAVSVYPFSVKLWKSYFNLSKKNGNGDAVADAARERGIKLN